MFGGPRMGLPGLDRQLTQQKIRPGTIRRIIPYALRYRWQLILLMTITASTAAITAVSPLILGLIIDKGILAHRLSVVIELSIAVVALSLLSAVLSWIQGLCSARVGQGLIYDLRNKVFGRVQQQSLAFFMRSQTGSLVSRLNTDVTGAQQAVTTILTQSVETILTLIFVIAAMFYLSWQITIGALVMVPFFFLPGRLVGRRVQRLTREQMQLNAELSSLTTERFTVGGAMLTKLYGRPAEESALFARQTGRVRDIAILASMYGQAFGIIVGLISTISLALVYGLGGALAIHGELQVGSIVAFVALMGRLYGPVNQLSTMQITVLTALVSFDRVFEIIDLEPLISESPGAVTFPAAPSGNDAAPDIEFDRVSFRYPVASEVSLASLESIALPMPERAGNTMVLREVSFRARSGQLTALVGPSGAGKTTVTHLVPRFYDPSSGAVRINDQDIRDLSLQSLHDTVGVVPQDAHMFHDTLRANLAYARPGATERDMIEACQAARIWDLIALLPDQLDTVVGERGYRFSGGEKQRIALARLLLKAPQVVVLDEATAHLDSESEASIQRALKTALAGRTSLVIAHRLSTVREADQILVMDEGRITERGTHEELLLAGGLYAELYRTQFAQQAPNGRAANITPAGPVDPKRRS